MHRLFMGVLAVALAVVWTGSVAFAGGWAVTTLDTVSAMHAGQTYQIGFVMRQHGVTPVRDGTPSIVATYGTHTVRFPARYDGGPGHYVAEVTFPNDGEWAWSVDQAPFPQEQTLGTIAIAAALSAPAAEAPSAPLAPRSQELPAELALLGIMLLAATVVCLGLASRRRTRHAPP